VSPPSPPGLPIVLTSLPPAQTGPPTINGGTAPAGVAGKTKAESSPVSYPSRLGAKIVSISSVEEQTMLAITSGGMDLHGTGMRILVGFLLVLLLLLIGAMIACNHNPFSCSCELVRFLNVSHTDLNIVTSLESAQTMPAITAGGTA
jgi:hypothetical protein